MSNGRASSVEAARTTWRSPSATMAAGRTTAGSSPTATAGNSTAGNARSPKRERAAEISTFSSAPSMVTAPDSSDRTMSTARRAGTTHSPSSRPMTSRSTRTVRSRSVPVTTRALPCAPQQQP